MQIHGASNLDILTNHQAQWIKMVFNEQGAILFPIASEHRSLKTPSISYEDDYKGNALAAMVRLDLVEIRYHKSFTDAKVTRIIKMILSQPELACLTGASVTYQGRALSL